MHSRRDFLGLLGAGAALPALAPTFPDNASLPPIRADYDMSWVDRVSAPHRVVFDIPEVSDGSGVWRAVLLQEEYRDVFGTFPDQMAVVLVIRHFGVALGMSHAFWARDGIGERFEVKDGEGNWATRNPVGPARDDASARARGFTLPSFIERGGIVLACDLAFNNVIVPRYRGEGMSREQARELALADLLPGVILQPSGFFAVIRAQQAGCALFCNG